jgi:phosphopantothenoylcysteine decarboxylase/phosphopantothenate--cysteine ligase
MNIVIGVTGGIACYKAADVVHNLVRRGHSVNVIMTKNAQEFVTPLTFQTLSQNRVVTDMFEKTAEWDVRHISLAQKADVFAVVPATANVIGKIACGIADDMLTTTIMAAQCRRVIAPAMNTAMWENPIVRDNINRLRAFGYEVLGTASGLLACGTVGQGALLSWERIVKAIEDGGDGK